MSHPGKGFRAPHLLQCEVWVTPPRLIENCRESALEYDHGKQENMGRCTEHL